MYATAEQLAKAEEPSCYALNSPSGGYKHWCPGVGSVWTDIFVPPHNNPFTPEGIKNVYDYWADAGIDVGTPPPLGTQITPPWPEPAPDLPYPTTPAWPDYPSTPPEPHEGDEGGGSKIFAILGIGAIALLAGALLK